MTTEHSKPEPQSKAGDLEIIVLFGQGFPDDGFKVVRLEDHQKAINEICALVSAGGGYSGCARSYNPTMKEMTDERTGHESVNITIPATQPQAEYDRGWKDGYRHGAWASKPAQSK